MPIRFRKKMDARDAVVEMIQRDLASSGARVGFDEAPRDDDDAKFTIGQHVARAFHLYNGYHCPIGKDWFAGGRTPPKINRFEFHLYVFAVEPRGEVSSPHYFICGYHQLRKWVLEFDAPRGRDWRDSPTWMAAIHPLSDSRGYFRWGDEEVDDLSKPSRMIRLDNIHEIEPAQDDEETEGTGQEGGESLPHLRLKEYIARNPNAVGLSRDALADVEHSFRTGDRVDVLFLGGGPEITVVEVEVAGASKLEVGVLQAIKYRALAAAEAGFPNLGPSTRVRAVLAAYETDYRSVRDLAERYEVDVVQIPRNTVL